MLKLKILFHNINLLTLGDAATSKCPFCKETLEADVISVHKRCMSKSINCSQCSDSVLLENWCDHEWEQNYKVGCSIYLKISDFSFCLHCVDIIVLHLLYFKKSKFCSFQIYLKILLQNHSLFRPNLTESTLFTHHIFKAHSSFINLFKQELCSL